MFISSGIDLKFHTWCNCVETTTVPVPSHQFRITDFSLCNDNSYIALIRQNAKPKILSSKDRNNVRIIHTLNIENATSLAFKHRTKRHIAVGTKVGDVVVYDTKDRMIANIFNKISLTKIISVGYSSDDQILYALDDNSILLFDESVPSNIKINKYKMQGQCRSFKAHPRIATQVAIGFSHGYVILWDSEKHTETVHLEMLPSPITAVTLSSCENFVVAAGNDVRITGCDPRCGEYAFNLFLEQESQVTSLDLHQNDQFLLIGCDDGVVKLYDIRTSNKPLYSAKCHESPVTKVLFENNNSTDFKFKDFEIKESLENVETLKAPPPQTNTDFSGAVYKIRRNLMKMLKYEMDCIEQHSNEHCTRFQKFFENELETIDGLIKKKWNVFNSGDKNQIVKAILSTENK